MPNSECWALGVIGDPERVCIGIGPYMLCAGAGLG